MSARAISPVHAAVAAALVVLGILGSAPHARAQSLADVAKKEEDRRKSAAEPAKVYTNKDLNHRNESTPPDAAAKPADAKDKDAKDAAKDGAKDKDGKDAAGKDKEPARDKAYWSGKMKALETKLLR